MQSQELQEELRQSQELSQKEVIIKDLETSIHIRKEIITYLEQELKKAKTAGTTNNI